MIVARPRSPGTLHWSGAAAIRYVPQQSGFSGGKKSGTFVYVACKMQQYFLPSKCFTLLSLQEMRPRANVSKVATGASSGVNPECWVDDHGDCLKP